MYLTEWWGRLFFGPKVTEPANGFLAAKDVEVEEAGKELVAVIKGLYGRRSVRIRAADGGSTNAAGIELTPLGNGYYDIDRFGLSFVPSPRHADMLFVTGPVTRNLE